MAPPRPRWEASKKTPPTKSQKTEKRGAKNPTSSSSDASAPASCIPIELQQTLLNIFKNAFAERFAEDVKPLIQEVKGHLFNRDFAAAFGKHEYLDAYALRWSASRAVGYADLLWSLREQLLPENQITEEQGASKEHQKRRKVVCLGGGAGAELVALGGFQHLLNVSTEIEEEKSGVDVIAADIADWTMVTETLNKQITSPPPLSKYAAAAVQATNRELITPNFFEASFRRLDVLASDVKELGNLTEGAFLVTLMFTLNELYSTSLPLTQKLLLQLTSLMPYGAMLLVVDSPGSYSTVTLNGAEKKYPMSWLLDHTLLKSATSDKREDKGDKKSDGKGDGLSMWDKVYEDESRWFRLDPKLKYPIDLENMRMQVHLYRRT